MFFHNIVTIAYYLARCPFVHDDKHDTAVISDTNNQIDKLFKIAHFN